MNEYLPADNTKALGGVANGLAKHILAATQVANKNGYGLTPRSIAARIAIGAKSTAVAVLLINMVNIEVAKYIPAIIGNGP